MGLRHRVRSYRVEGFVRCDDGAHDLEGIAVPDLPFDALSAIAERDLDWLPAENNLVLGAGLFLRNLDSRNINGVFVRRRLKFEIQE